MYHVIIDLMYLGSTFNSASSFVISPSFTISTAILSAELVLFFFHFLFEACKVFHVQ